MKVKSYIHKAFKLGPKGLSRKAIGKTQRKRVNALKKHPPVLEEDKIVFYSAEDYSDNPRALFEYMMANGYDRRYRFVWLVSDPSKYKDLETDRVKFVRLKDSFTDQYTYETRLETLTAKYLFYSHSMNWAAPVRMNQVFIDLWHGCGYKGQKIGLDRRVFFDYCLVPSEFFVPIKAVFFRTQERKILPLGYPRYDWFKTSQSAAEAYSAVLRETHNAEKLIMWMPTFRQSSSRNLNDDTITGDFNLPITNSEESLRRLDDICARDKTVLLLKRHHLQLDYDIDDLGLKNIVTVDSEALDEYEINLYELLAHTDALISDYSSVAIDYLLLDKPIGFTLDDFDSYESKRGWSIENPLEYMPGHHIYSIEQLESFVDDISNGVDPYSNKRQTVREELHNECDCYCKRITEYFDL